MQTLLYPFDLESAPILRHNTLLHGLEIKKAVSPKGWGYIGKDASLADGGHHIGLVVDGDFEQAIDNCETLLIVDSYNNFDFDEKIFPKIEFAAKHGIKIICARYLNDAERKKAENACRNSGSSFFYLNDQNSMQIKKNPGVQRIQIDTPIVFVLGTGEHTDKFEIQLSLREELLKRGYKVSQIGSRSCCKLFGFHSIPEFMTSTGISEGDKIICFNNFVKQIELNEKPELIVIGIPGGAMEIDNMFNNNYEISRLKFRVP